MESKFLSELAGYLQNTLCPDQDERKKAELFMKTMESQPYYSLCLLNIVLSDAFPMPTRLAAAVTLKNFVKAYWKTHPGEADRIPPDVRDQVRNQILGALLSVSGCLQPQLSEVIGAIWREDFPHKWPTLIPELVGRMAQQGADLNMVQGVLHTAHTLFKRYRHECAGDDLFREMKTVIGQFGAPLTELAKNLLALVVSEQRLPDGARLVTVFNCLLLVCKIFLSLNCQDLPEFFEDNINDWMTIFRSLLQLDPSITQYLDAATQGTDSNGFNSVGEKGVLVEQVKSQVCDNMSLYASKYETEFAPYLPGFVTDVWEMLINTNGQTKYDMLIGNAIEFLSSVISRPQHRHLFENPEILQKLCEKVILPNMHFRSLDEELFSDNPEEYLRLDLEGSDTHTRRRAACHLVHVLCQAFEGPVVANFSTYIEHLLAEYAQNPTTAWTSKDAALLLVTSVAAKGKTEKLGVTISTELVNIQSFYETHVLPELLDSRPDHLPVIKADCMRYAIAFRGLLSPIALVNLINLAPNLLAASSPVVHSYAAALVDRLLSMQLPGSMVDPVITKDQISDPQLLIERILALLHSGFGENVYVIRALMRVCSCLQDRCLPSMNNIVSCLLSKLTQVAKNPSKPSFNHFMFETMCLCIQITCTVDLASVVCFETAFFPVFQEILQNDVVEFVPYVFQLLSVMLEQYPMSQTVATACSSNSKVVDVTPNQLRPSPPYSALLQRLLIPSLWDQHGNIPSLSRLVRAFVLHDIEEVVSSNKISAVLGVYQRLIASSTHDHHAFSLLGALVLATPIDLLQSYLRQVFIVIFRRLQSSKTEKFMKTFVWFISRFVLVYSPNQLIQLVDGVQQNLFSRVLEKILLPYAEVAISAHLPVYGFGKSSTNTTVCRIQWHQVSVGLTRLITETGSFFDSGTYGEFWAPLVGGILAGLRAGPARGGDAAADSAVAFFTQTTPKERRAFYEERFVDVDMDSSGTYGQLTFAVPRIPELYSAITDPRIYLAQSLRQAALTHPAKVVPLLNSSLDAQSSAYLQSCFTRAGISL